MPASLTHRTPVCSPFCTPPHAAKACNQLEYLQALLSPLTALPLLSPLTALPTQMYVALPIAPQVAKVRNQVEYLQAQGRKAQGAIAAKQAEVAREEKALAAARAAEARHAKEGEAMQVGDWVLVDGVGAQLQ